MHTIPIEVVILADRNATVAEIKYGKDPEAWYVTGSAKREPGEVYDEQLGCQLAVARAMSAMAGLLADNVQEVLDVRDREAADKLMAHMNQKSAQTRKDREMRVAMFGTSGNTDGYTHSFTPAPPREGFLRPEKTRRRWFSRG